MAEYTGFGSTENDEARRNLFNYALQGKWDEVMKLYEQHPWLHLEKTTRSGDTALHMAVRYHQEKVVQKMVKLVRTPEQYEGVLKSQNVQRNTPLHLAASIGNVSMCECFTRKCQNLLDICNEDGETPLFLAARHGKIGAFFFVLREPRESDLATYIHRRNNKGETILHLAIAGGHFGKHFRPPIIVLHMHTLCKLILINK